MKQESNEKQRVPSMLRAESKNAGYLVLWLDCDKEGENICFEVVDILEKDMRLIPGKVM
jgi:DNA topoisomerase-3